MRQGIVIALAVLVAGVAGWATMRKPAPKPAPAPTPKPAPAPAPAPKPPPEPPPPVRERPAALPPVKGEPPRPEAPPRDFKGETAAETRIATVLTTEIPPGIENYNAVMERCRALLKDPTANAVFLSDLPSLTQRQLVVFWDVLWLHADYQKKGFGAFGDDFGRALTRRLAELLPTWQDPVTRGLVCNMLLPDLKYLTDDEFERLKAVIAADPDKGVRERLGKLKR